MTVADPCAGWGGFLSAAVRMGRGAIGAELDPAAHEIAARVVRGERARPRVEQPELFGPMTTGEVR
jgi:DNA modification methylase